MEIFAHRGDSAHAPENTLAAFRRVAGTGADGVEFDVQLTRDGVAVVIHDERVDRTTDGTGPVGEQTLAELQRLDAGGRRGAAHAGERIPTLDEALEALRDTRLVLNIELKTLPVPYPGLVAAVIESVARFGLGERVMLSSFDHHRLLEAARLAPEIPRAALFGDSIVEPWSYAARQGFHAVHLEYRMCTAELVDGCHGLGLAVRVYTVDDEGDARRMAGIGVDGIFTDDPARMAAARAILQKQRGAMPPPNP